jgi:hypothetical protein
MMDTIRKKDIIHNVSLADVLRDVPSAPLSLRSRVVSSHQIFQRPKRKVRWNDTPEEIASSCLEFQNKSFLETTTEEIRIKWYDRSELILGKKFAHHLAAKIRKREQAKEDGYNSLLAHVYESCHAGEKNLLIDNYFDRIVKWMRKCPSHRGIEHLIVPSTGQDRKEKRSLVIKTIVILQNSTSLGLSGEELSEFLCTRSMRLSQFSRNFARIMGQADACALLPTSKK